MRSRTAALLVATITALTLSACAPGSSGSGGDSKTIKVGFDSPQAYTNNMPVLIAIQNGYFAQRGLTVSTVGFNAGSDALKALLSGSIQIQAGVGFDVVSAHAKNQDSQAFYGIASKSDFALFVRNDSPIKSFGDLAGKSVAISGFGSYTDYLSKAVSHKEGIDDFKEVPLHQTPAIIGALLNGSVDSAWEPMALAPLFEGKARAIPVAEAGLDSQYSTLSATSSYLSANQSTVQDFVAAIKDAIAYHQSHRTESIDLAMQKLGVPRASAESGYDAAAQIYNTDGQINQAGMKAMADAVPELGLGATAPSTAAMINSSFAG